MNYEQTYESNLQDCERNMFTTLYYMDKLLLSSDNYDVINSIKIARTKIWNDFAKAFTNIKIVNGIKTIKTTRGEIRYYCNGLIELCNWQLVGEPFEYIVDKNKNNEPKYDSMFRPGDIDTYLNPKKSYMPATASKLLDDYILSKIKPIKKKMNLNIYNTIYKMESFIESFNDLYQNTGICDNADEIFDCKELEAYQKLGKAYENITLYCTSGYHCEIDMSDMRNHYYGREIGNIDYDESLLNIKTCDIDGYNPEIYDYRIGRTSMPYLDEDDVIEMIRLHKSAYANATIDGYACRTIKLFSEIRDDIAKDIAYDFYFKKYKTHNPETCNKTYNLFGYTSMYYSLIGKAKCKQPHLIKNIIYYDIDCGYTHEELIESMKTMLENLKWFYKTLYSIPNESMHNFMIEQKILKADYYPE